jgi:hypothetical protein
MASVRCNDEGNLVKFLWFCKVEISLVKNFIVYSFKTNVYYAALTVTKTVTALNSPIIF